MWFKKKKGVVSSGIVGLELTPEGLALAHVIPSSSGWKVPFCSFIQERGADHQRRALYQLVEQHNLLGAPCHYVLHPSEYELLLTDAPDVEDEELAAAIKWRVKDLLSMPMEEAVIDAFALPDHAYRGRMKMVYVVAVRRQTIERLVQIMQHSGLELAVIDITELALRNLIQLQPFTEGASIGLLRLRGTGGIINLIQDNQLCFTRSIETPLQEFEMSPTEESINENRRKVERLVLELQRSLDYYEAQIGMGAVNQIWLIPLKQDVPALVETLQERLSIELKVFDLNKITSLNLNADIPLSGQAYCFSALGAALRKGG